MESTLDASPAPSTPSKDFRRLKTEGHARGGSKAIGQAFCDCRDVLARGLIAVGVTPNMLTLTGFLANCAAGYCLFLGAGNSFRAEGAAGLPPYLLYTAYLLFFAHACDMLDGSVARIGKLNSPLGAVLDSSIDRFSDMAVYLGIMGHFALRGNLTYTLLSVLAMCNANLISYIKARSETLIPDCSIGYWLRGERCAAVLIAATAGTIPAVLWQQAISPAFTALRRLVWTYQVLSAQESGRPAPSARPEPGFAGLLRPWRYPRGSVPYDLVTGLNIAFIVCASWSHTVFTGGPDPLRHLLTR